MSRDGHLSLKAALVLIFSSLAVPLHAADRGTTGSDLYVCNKGSVAVEVVSATRGLDILRGFDKYYWLIEGATAIPGKCAIVKNPDGDPSYIAFGFTDSKGEWGSGRTAQVPDLGSTEFSLLSKTEKILTSGMRTICARKDATRYVLDDEFSIDCNFTLTGRAVNVGEGPLVALTSALYFHPDVRFCDPVMGVGSFPVRPDQCDPTHYYLNISPSATDRELHTTQGTKSGADALTGGDENSSLCGKVSCTDLFLQGLAQAIKDNQTQQAANTNGPRPGRRPVIPPPQPPPPPRSAAPRASTPGDDDPIGQGGFITRPSNPAPAPARAYSLQWVRADILAYIEASKTGFDAYKKGDVQVSQGYRSGIPTSSRPRREAAGSSRELRPPHFPALYRCEEI